MLAYDTPYGRALAHHVKRMNDERMELGEMHPTSMFGGGRPRHIVPHGMNTMEHYGESGSVGMMGGKHKPKSASRAISRFLQPSTRALKHGLTHFTKQAVPMLEQEALMGMMGGKHKHKSASRAVSNFLKPSTRALKHGLTHFTKQAVPMLEQEALMGLAGGRRHVHGAKKTSPWIEHVKKVQAEHGCSYKEALQLGKHTYHR